MIFSLFLAGIEVAPEGIATEFKSVESIIFKGPDILVAVLPAGLVLFTAGEAPAGVPNLPLI